MHGINIKRRDLAHALAALHSAANDFVVDMGDIAHILDLVAAATQPALHYVEADQHARMPQLAKIVDRHAASVHADLAGFYGFQSTSGPRMGGLKVLKV